MSLMSGILQPGPWLPLFIEFTAKSTLILLVGGIASGLLWRSSAAVRHMVWSVACACVLALPLMSALMPEWNLAVLPSPAAAAFEAAGRGTAPVADGASSPPLSPHAVHVGTENFPAETWLPQLAAGLAWFGIVIGLLWLAAGLLSVAYLGRRAERVRDTSWLRTAQDASEQLGLRRPVLLLRSREASMPATWGLLWPSVIIPSDAEQWTDDRRRAVLSHELAHVKRFDCLTQAVARLACALLWWHPAIWYAARRLRIERERACDDLVLAAGARPSDYATHLLEIARSHRTMYMASPALLSMAKPSQLESRLLRVLDGDCARTIPSARAIMITLAAGLALVGPLSAMQPDERAAPVPNTAAALGDVRARSPSPPAAEARSQEALSPPPSSTRQSAAAPGDVRAELPSPPEASAAAADPSIDELVMLRGVGVDRAYISELREAGYAGLTGRQLARMKGSGVSGDYIADMNAAGFGRLTPEQMVLLSSVGVRSAYVAELRRRGLANLSLQQVARLKGAGVTGDYITRMNALGLGTLDAETLVKLHSIGITPEVVQDLAAEGFGPLSPEKLVRLRTEAE